MKQLEKWLSQFLIGFGIISLFGGGLMIIWVIIELILSLFVPLEEFPLTNFIFLIVLSGFFGFVIYLFYTDWKGGSKHWEEFATLNGLHVIKNKVGRRVAILGRLDDRLVKFSEKSLPSIHDPKRKHIYNNLCIKLKTTSSITLSLTKEDITIKFHKGMKTYQDIEVGNKQFDQKFFIQCSNESFIQRLLTTDIQRELEIMYQQFNGELYINKEEVGYKDMNRMNNEKRLSHFHGMLPILFQVAEIIEAFDEDGKDNTLK